VGGGEESLSCFFVVKCARIREKGRKREDMPEISLFYGKGWKTS